MTTERLTYGYSETVSDLAGQSEPITLTQVKAKLNIDFDAHDTEITRLITAVRQGVEKIFSKSLIGHSVSVLWLNFYDDAPLPYMPFANADGLTVTDLDGSTLSSDSYKVRKGGTSSYFIGTFPDGVQVSYNTKGLEDDHVNSLLIDAVGLCLFEDMTTQQAINKVFKYANL